MKKNTPIIIIGLVILGLLAAVFVLPKRSSVPDSEKVHVVASFYPLYYFASQVAGENATVVNITPAGAEPHDFEPTTEDIAHITESDLLILNGVGLEPWGDKVHAMIQGNRPVIVEVAQDLATKEFVHEGEVEIDPHTWLDPVLAQEEVRVITEALKQVDPQHTTDYDARSQVLITKLAALDQEFSQRLVTCQQHDIVVSHQAFGYLAARYNLNQVPISGLSPDEEPSPKQIAEVAEFARAHNVNYIFFETLVSPRLAETIASEVGAQTMVLDPVAGLTEEAQNRGSDYFSVQRENLNSLTTALSCP